MKIVYDEAQAYQNLIYAVIARALMDTFKTPMKNGMLPHETSTAFEFLFGDDVDVWLELVDMDAGQFKRRLKDSMFDDMCKVSDMDKRAFRINYKRWYQQKYAPRLIAAGMKL